MGYDEHSFRAKIKAERERRGWTQSELARQLSELGVRWRWSTVAKIEAGDRGVQLAEASALADVFGISLDLLAGRRARPVGDLTYARRSLLDVVHSAALTQMDILTALNSRDTELVAADPEGRYAALLGDVHKLRVLCEAVWDEAQRIGRDHGGDDA